MLSQKEYVSFNLKMTKILKDCSVEEKDENGYFYYGNTTQTENNVYYYNKNAINYREDLIELCKTLPKLKNKLTGTARNYRLFGFNYRYQSSWAFKKANG